MSASSDISYFVGDTDDGKIIVAATLPAGTVLQGPVQKLRVSGPGLIPPPKSPMTRKEFEDWKKLLDDRGYTADLQFV